MLALRELKAPSSFGYNDMAILIAFGQFLITRPVNAPLISKYLVNSRCVPGDARMPPEMVGSYLELLASRALITPQASEDYTMRHDVCDALFTHYLDLKSPKVVDGLFHGFAPFFGIEVRGSNGSIADLTHSIFAPVIS